MQALTVRLLPYKSRYYPVNAVYTIRNIRYNNVFETVKQAFSYFNNRFYPVKINYLIHEEVKNNA